MSRDADGVSTIEKQAQNLNSSPVARAEGQPRAPGAAQGSPPSRRQRLRVALRGIRVPPGPRM